MDACDECRFYSLGCTLAPVVANSSRQAVAGSPTPTAGACPACLRYQLPHGCTLHKRCGLLPCLTRSARLPRPACTPARLCPPLMPPLPPCVASPPAGFPVRYELNDLPGFTAQAGQGVPGADITCPQSLLPGKCAVNDTTDVVVLCIRTPECAAVVHYFRGALGRRRRVVLAGVAGGAARARREGGPRAARLPDERHRVPGDQDLSAANLPARPIRPQASTAAPSLCRCWCTIRSPKAAPSCPPQWPPFRASTPDPWRVWEVPGQQAWQARQAGRGGGARGRAQHRRRCQGLHCMCSQPGRPVEWSVR